MDIRLAVTSAGLFMAVYLVTLGVPFYFYQDGHHLAALVLAILLATVAPVIYARLRQRAEASLLKEERSYQAAIREAVRALGRFKEIDAIANFLVQLLAKTVKARSVAFYEFDSSKYVLRDLAGEGNGYAAELPEDMPLAQLFKASYGVIALDEMRREDRRGAALSAEFLRTHPAAIAVPVRRGENILGVIFLGDKQSGAAFSQGDLDVLSSVVEPAALAIENARFLQEIKSAQEQLFEAEKMATIGFLTGGISHQLRNRFASLLFYADFALKNLAEHRGRVLPAEVCDEAMRHLDKIVSGIHSSKEVLEGILNYAADRQTRMAISLKKLVSSSLEFIGFKITPGSVLFEQDISEEVPPVTGNFAQLQEVLFNIIDNAYHSMMEKRAADPAFRPRISFAAHRAERMVRLVITDNGNGIRPEDMRRLFDPFFSTKRTSGKGHGLGLYMMRQIIEKNHGGRIAFSSVYGQGVRVDIDLPAAKVSA